MRPSSLAMLVTWSGCGVGAPAELLVPRPNGSPVAVPIPAPLDDDDGLCDVFTDTETAALPGDRLYVHFTNMRCGLSGQACQVVDLGTGTVAPPPGGCIPGNPRPRQIEPLGQDWVSYVEGEEGGVALVFGRYSPERGLWHAERLDPAFGCLPRIEREGEAVVVQVACTEPCSTATPCDETWRWTAETGLRRTDGVTPR